jgi:hypothetical protein
LSPICVDGHFKPAASLISVSTLSAGTVMQTTPERTPRRRSAATNRSLSFDDGAAVGQEIAGAPQSRAEQRRGNASAPDESIINGHAHLGTPHRRSHGAGTTDHDVPASGDHAKESRGLRTPVRSVSWAAVGEEKRTPGRTPGRSAHGSAGNAFTNASGDAAKPAARASATAAAAKQAAMKAALQRAVIGTPEFAARMRKRQGRRGGDDAGGSPDDSGGEASDSEMPAVDRKPLFPGRRETEKTVLTAVSFLTRWLEKAAPSLTAPAAQAPAGSQSPVKARGKASKKPATIKSEPVAQPSHPISLTMHSRIAFLSPQPFRWLGADSSASLSMFSTGRTVPVLTKLLQQSADIPTDSHATVATATLHALCNFYAFPASWWPESILSATAGTTARLHASIVKEWRDTHASTAAARARITASLAAQAFAANLQASQVAKATPSKRSVSKETHSARKERRKRKEKADKTAAVDRLKGIKSKKTVEPPAKSAEAMLAERIKAQRREREQVKQASADADTVLSSETGASDTALTKTVLLVPTAPAVVGAKRKERPRDAETSDDVSMAKRGRMDDVAEPVAYVDPDAELAAAVTESGWWDAGDETAVPSASTTLKVRILPIWWPGSAAALGDMTRFDSASAAMKASTISLAGGRAIHAADQGKPLKPLPVSVKVAKPVAPAGIFGLARVLAGAADVPSSGMDVETGEVEEGRGKKASGKQKPTAADGKMIQPRCLNNVRSAEADSIAEWTRRVAIWQRGVLSAWNNLVSAHEGYPTHGLLMGGNDPWKEHPYFLLRFGPHEEGGNVIFVCHTSALGETASDFVCIIARSSRSLRMRLRERAIDFTTPFDPDLGLHDLGGGNVADSAEELQALSAAQNKAFALQPSFIRINDVDRIRAEQALSLLQKNGIVEHVDAALATGKSKIGSLGASRSSLRGTANSVTGLLMLSGQQSVCKVLQCLIDAALPIPAVRTDGGAFTPSFPISLFAVVDTNAMRGLKTVVHPDKDVDVPQILSSAPFEGAALCRNRITTVTREVGTSSLQIQGILLPTVAESIAAIVGFQQDYANGVPPSEPTIVELDDNLVTSQFNEVWSSTSTGSN